MGMLFVEIGREVSPKDITHRYVKAAVTGIIDNKFVVVIKQDKTHEIVRVEDLVLNDKVYNSDDLKNKKGDLFNAVNQPKQGNDFDRFKNNLKQKTTDVLIKKAG